MIISRKRILIIIMICFAAALACAVISDISSSRSFTIIDPSLNRPQRYTYKNLPSDFLHSGRTLIFTAQSDTTTSAIAAKALPFTGYYKSSKLEKAILQYNSISRGKISAGNSIVIPHSLPALIPDMKNRSKSPLIFARGLYFTGNQAGSEKMIASLDSLVEAGINAVVFDAKDVTGIVNYNSRVPEVNDLGTNSKRSIDDIDKLIREFKSRNIYVIARVAVFRDHLLAKRDQSMAIHSANGRLWNESSSELWCDPTNRDTQDYNMAIAIELAERGVDEIQFDYIRFPTSAAIGDARFAWSFGKMQKDRVIEHFLSRAHSELSKRNVNFSIDVFGIVAWGHEPDIMKTGQRIELLSKYCDVISPMLYPSHFNDNFDGYSKPGDEPYYFIHTGCLKFRERAGSTPIRPWLQAFGWKVSNYNSRYILDQISASHDARTLGYLFWNASSNYDIVLKALKELKTVKISKNESITGKEHL